MTLAEYAALLQLAEAPGRRLRMNQLADGIFLSRSGVTRLIDRLEADGLVDRSHCSSDGRGAEAVLTDVGQDRLRQASRTHLRGIETYFLDSVEPATSRRSSDRAEIGRRVRSDLEPSARPPDSARDRLDRIPAAIDAASAGSSRPAPRTRIRGGGGTEPERVVERTAVERRDGQPGQERVAAADRVGAADRRRRRGPAPVRLDRDRAAAPRVTTTAPPVRAASSRARRGPRPMPRRWRVAGRASPPPPPR